eukprot:11213516-Lingulodinium_polyedra.AAC.1
MMKQTPSRRAARCRPERGKAENLGGLEPPGQIAEGGLAQTVFLQRYRASREHLVGGNELGTRCPGTEKFAM